MVRDFTRQTGIKAGYVEAGSGVVVNRVLADLNVASGDVLVLLGPPGWAKQRSCGAPRGSAGRAPGGSHSPDGMLLNISPRDLHDAVRDRYTDEFFDRTTSPADRRAWRHGACGARFDQTRSSAARGPRPGRRGLVLLDQGRRSNDDCAADQTKVVVVPEMVALSVVPTPMRVSFVLSLSVTERLPLDIPC